MTDIEKRIGRLERKQDFVIHLWGISLSGFTMLTVGIGLENSWMVVLAPCMIIVGSVGEMVQWKRREKNANKASKLTS